MNKGEFIHKIQSLTGIQDQAKAEKATGAVLNTLCGRLTHDEAKDLDAQLPMGIKELCSGNVLKEMISRVSGPSRLERDQFVDKVRDKAKLLDVQEAERVTVAVFHTIKEQITDGESEDVASQLPARLKVMWLES